MGHYSPNPHYAPDDFSDEDARHEAALEISGRWFSDATKPQHARYAERMAAIRPYAGSPEWERAREAATKEFKDSTAAAAALCNETYREVLATGEVSDALSYRWDLLLGNEATRVAADVLAAARAA